MAVSASGFGIRILDLGFGIWACYLVGLVCYGILGVLSLFMYCFGSYGLLLEFYMIDFEWLYFLGFDCLVVTDLLLGVVFLCICV